jgi:hypothetical protein
MTTPIRSYVTILARHRGAKFDYNPSQTAGGIGVSLVE